MMPSHVSLDLSGERFAVVYRLIGDEAEALAKARHICVEQTVEFPEELLPEGDIRDHIVGRIEALKPINSGCSEVTISFASEISGFDLNQLLTVVFGNIGLRQGIRVERIHFAPGLLRSFKGPRFGRDGLRSLLGVQRRPLICTALKPLGLSSRQLAGLAYEFALGGLDIVKDDHGLADQRFAPFHERVQRCAEAVQRANAESGGKCLYAPNITGRSETIVERALFAKECGAGALLVAPGVVGFDVMRQLADDDRIALPIISHPALQGSFVISSDSGISHYALFGQIARLAGADASIYPNYGGRFFFSAAACRSIAQGTAVPMSHIKPIFPMPAGGMTLERTTEMVHVYGPDVVFLIGGSLYAHGPNIVANCQYFRDLVQQASSDG